MARQFLLVLPCLFCLLFASSFAVFENKSIALEKRVTAEPSCGVNKSELYYPITEEHKHPFERKIKTCDQKNETLKHPPEAIVDGNPTTFWQSESSKDVAVITIDLSGPEQKYYFVQDITIYFGEYYRPKQMAIYKKSANNGMFERWHYLVTDYTSCEKVFNRTFVSLPSHPDTVLCTNYKSLAKKEYDKETIQIQGGRGLLVNNAGILNTKLLGWMNTSAVKIRFSGLHMKFDKLASYWQHYDVREIEISGYCDCNGHADGKNCSFDDILGDRRCDCLHGTCGVHCEECCPAYNQYPYEQGAHGPFIPDKSKACEKCNCHNHSNVCVYNATIANNTCSYDNNATNDNCSMDMHGTYSGGGVCINCTDDTEGINCQRCRTGYYRATNKYQWDKDACQPCKCSKVGTKNTTRNGVLYLDCVRDQEEAVKLLVNLNPGDCLCKSKTTGRRCDRCIDGYYNLTGDKPEGCSACNCTTIGTRNGSIVCNDSGLCFCKENVQGIKCDNCLPGTFNLADTNKNGCTRCSCSGITTNCTSTSLYKSKVQHNISGWKLVRGDSDAPLQVMKIKDEVDGRSVDMISFNMTTEQNLFWMADEDYFQGKSQTSSYGGYLSFAQKVSLLPNRTLSATQIIILKGPRNISIKQLLTPLLVPGLRSPLTSKVKMVEFNWTISDSGAIVNRSMFMLVLAKIEGIQISVLNYTPGAGTYQASFGNVQLSSVSNHSNGTGIAVDVEQCLCGKQYTGLSCERCARSYHRQNTNRHTFFGVCVRCNCHGHTQDCDPDTGECLNCQHNTTGFTCELCQDGFYGVATNGTSNDCQKCPCDRPRTVNDSCTRLPNGSAKCSYCAQGYEKNRLCNRCDWGYFGRPDLPGGNCSRCQCNNNSEKCDRETGNCLGFCENNSTGRHCERCENGTYGDATQQQCRACTCDEVGSHNNVCNHTTGVCSCKENVDGFNCSLCVDNAFGFSDTGCTQCNCNQFGSDSLQCNNTGICECKNFTHGEKCDLCDDYYYGLPNATCQECACNVTGSNHTICNHVNGQCPCKPGVDGRQCDICKVQYKGFSDKGCEPCPACTMKLQSRLDETNMTLIDLNIRMEQANQSLDLQSQMDQLENNITRVKKLQEEYASSAKILEEYRLKYPNNSLNATIKNITNREKQLSKDVSQLQIRMSDEINKKHIFLNNTLKSYDYAVFVNETTQDIINRLNEMAKDLTAKEGSSLAVVNQFNNSLSKASAQDQRYHNLKPLVDQSINNATQAIEQVNNQIDNINQLNKKLKQYKEALNNIKATINNETIHLQYNMTEIKTSLDNVSRTLNKTDKVLIEASSYVKENNKFIAEGEKNYQKVQEELQLLYKQLGELKTVVIDVNKSIIFVRSLVSNASRHAQALTTEAETLNDTFSAARRHGEVAVWAIDQYDELTKKMNSSLELLKEANASVHELISRIKNLTVSSENLNKKVSKSLRKSENLLEQTKARNINISGLSYNVSQAYGILVEANTTCRNVKKTFTIFDEKIDQLRNTSTKLSPAITSLSQNATMIVSLARNLSGIIDTKLKILKDNLAETEGNYLTFASLVANMTALKLNTTNTVNQTDALLPNISQSINQALNISRETNATQKNLTARLKNLERLLRSAKEKVAKFRLAMQVRGNTSVQVPPTARCISNTFLNEISLDFKTNSSNGLLFYMAQNPNNTQQSISLRLVGDFVRFTYNVSSYSAVVTNWMVPIADNIWHRVYATRYRDNMRLTVINLSDGVFRTYEGPVIFREMECQNSTTIVLGGLPTSQIVKFTDRYFNGDLDNFVLNQEKVDLWEPIAVQGRRRFAAKRTIPQTRYDKCVTFHGNGFIRQLAGTYDNTRTNSTLQFQFRTFFKNAILVIVEANTTQLVYNVSLREGRVIFQYSNITLSSLHSEYANGNWYNVNITRTLKNASLSVTSLSAVTPPGTTPDQVSHSTRLPIYLLNAKYVYFGGTNESGNRFAGGMKMVYLSSIITNAAAPRELNDKNFTLDQKGVSFDKCLPTVKEGLAYSGYTALKSNHIGKMTSFTIRFKTNEPSGLLAYSENEGVHFYLALFHGNIYVTYVNGNAVVRLHSNTETLNDKGYHIVQVNMIESSIKLQIDTPSGETHSGELPLPSPVPLGDLFYIAGIEQSVSIPFDVPVLSSFKGDINHVMINEDRVLDGSSPSPFEAGTSVGVSAAGVSPAPAVIQPTAEPTQPPTCAGEYPEKVPSDSDDEFHFPGHNSFILLKPDQTLLDTMRLSFVVVLEMRALSPNGVLFLAVDDMTNPKQFVSLELVDGHIVYQFKTGEELIKMKTTGNYAIGGFWYTINLLRIHQFGAIVVPENKEYNRDLKENNGQTLNISYLFVGGVQNNVNTSMLKNPSAPSFFGCIRKMSIQTHSQTKKINFLGETVQNRTSNIQAGICYSHVQPQIGFNATGYAKLVGPYSFSGGSNLSIRFRTFKRSGLLFFATDQNNGNQMLVEKVNGQIVLSYLSDEKRTTVAWVDPDLESSKNVNSSFALCDNKYHTIIINRSLSNVKLMVNNKKPVFVNISDSVIEGAVYVGGVPRGLNVAIGSTSEPLIGCVEHVIINTYMVDFKHELTPEDATRVEFGCRAPVNMQKTYSDYNPLQVFTLV